MEKNKIILVNVALLIAIIFFGAITGYIFMTTKVPKKDIDPEKISLAKNSETYEEEINEAESGEETYEYEAITGFSVNEKQDNTNKSTAKSKENKKKDSKKNSKKDENGFVYDDVTVHRYDLFVEDVTWSEAFQACIDRGGYLARINSQIEFDTITNYIISEGKQDITFFLGGNRQSDSDQYYWLTEDGDYVSGELTEGAYGLYWLSGEPSFGDVDEDGNDTEETCIDMFYYSAENRFAWNDVPDDVLSAGGSFLSGKLGYICEYEH